MFKEYKFSAIITGLILVGLSISFISCKGDEAKGSKNPTSSSSLSPEARSKIFHDAPVEVLKPTLWDVGDTTISNESRLELFYDSVKDIKGVYVGVGSTQNFLLAAWAKSEWIYLMDFTRIVVAVNKIHLEFIKTSKTPAEFVALWKRKNKKAALKIIKEKFGSEPNYRFYKSSYRKAQPWLATRFRLVKSLAKRGKYQVWITSQEQYDHIRNLALKNRIRPVQGNLVGKTTLKGIGEATRKMGVPVRIVYYSNAEEYNLLNPYPKQFRDNMLGLTGDSKSIVVRTISISRHKLPWAPGSELASKNGFHYNIQPWINFQEWLSLPSKVGVGMMLKTGKIEGKTGFSRVDVVPENLKPKTVKTAVK